MSELQLVLNKFKIIDEKFSSIPLFADFTWVENKRQYNTKLVEVNKQLEIGLVTFSNSKREKVLQKWTEYINSNNPDQIVFNKNDIEILSFQSDIIKNESFWDLLMDESLITNKVIIGLVYSVHSLWFEIKDLDKILDTLTFILLKNKDNNKIIELWRSNLELILGKKAAFNLATKLVEENLNLMSLSDRYFLSLINTNLGKEVERKVLEAKLNKFRREKNIKSTDLNYILSALHNGFFSKTEGNNILSLLIQIVNERPKDIQKACIEIFRDYFFNNIDYKDPREYPEKWLNFDNIGKNIFMTWLNEEDIRVFFDLFIDYDPHQRKDFWLKYVGKIKRTTTLIGKNVNQNIKNKDKIKSLEELGNKFLLLEAPTNAFILEFENMIAVEFSEIGNACYIYRKTYFDTIINHKNHSINSLKNKMLAINVVTHNKGWQNKLVNWFATRGIRA